MVRWRICLALAVLLLLPVIRAKSDDDDDDDRREDGEEDDDDEDDDDDDDGSEKSSGGGGGGGRVMSGSVSGNRRAPILVSAPKPTPIKPPKKRPLECYVCAYKSETPLRACLDPIKFRVHTITCHSTDDRCFTSVITKGDAYEAVVRGCRSGCIGSTETTCCEHNRCNNQAFAMPAQTVQVAKTEAESGANKQSVPPTILFFVSVLLILQTAMKVAFV